MIEHCCLHLETKELRIVRIERRVHVALDGRKILVVVFEPRMVSHHGKT
jgi:hypothetical protein